jgi:hypothetical protein
MRRQTLLSHPPDRVLLPATGGKPGRSASEPSVNRIKGVHQGLIADRRRLEQVGLQVLRPAQVEQGISPVNGGISAVKLTDMPPMMPPFVLDVKIPYGQLLTKNKGQLPVLV